MEMAGAPWRVRGLRLALSRAASSRCGCRGRSSSPTRTDDAPSAGELPAAGARDAAAVRAARPSTLNPPTPLAHTAPRRARLCPVRAASAAPPSSRSRAPARCMGACPWAAHRGAARHGARRGPQGQAAEQGSRLPIRLPGRAACGAITRAQHARSVPLVTCLLATHRQRAKQGKACPVSARHANRAVES